MAGKIKISYPAAKDETNILNSIDGMEFFFGKTNGEFYLPGMLREKLSAIAPRPVSLGISVNAWFPKQPCLLNGSYSYTYNAKSYTNSFIATNNLALVFFGDSLQTCQIVRDTNNCPIQLTIDINGKEVFNSGLVSDTNTIQYKNKQ